MFSKTWVQLPVSFCRRNPANRLLGGGYDLERNRFGTIARYQPQIILTHSCGAVWGKNVLIVMDAAQTVEVCRSAPESTIVAIHMEALDHATVSRVELHQYASAHGVKPGQLLIPADGETLVFSR